MTASQPNLLKIMGQPIARPGRVHICQQPLGVTFKKSIEHAYLFLYDKCTTKRTG